MSFPRFYDSIIELALNKVLNVRLARGILRKGGFLRGGEATVEQAEEPSFFPPGGRPGDVAVKVHYDKTFNPGLLRWSWHTPNYLRNARQMKAKLDQPGYAMGKSWHAGTFSNSSFGYRFGPPGGVEENLSNYPGAPSRQTSWERPLGGVGSLEELVPHASQGNMPVALFTFGIRNQRFANTGSTVAALDTDVYNGLKSQYLLVWEDIPAGTWMYPYNVPWFITRRDLTPRRGQYYPRQIKIRTMVAEGNPAADLVFKFGQTASGPWTDMVGVNLEGGVGPKTSDWIPFPEGSAASDVWVGLFLNARSSISTLHLGPVEVLMRWAPRNHHIPELVAEFGQEYQKIGGTPTLDFALEAPGRLVPGPPGSAFYWADYDLHPVQYHPTPDPGIYYDGVITGGLGRAGYAAPGWVAARIIPRRNPTNPKVIIQMVESLPVRYVVTDQGDGTVLLQVGYAQQSGNANIGLAAASNCHAVGHAFFGAQHGGNGIMRENFIDHVIYGTTSVYETIAPNTDDVRSVYDWLWGDTANPTLPT